jgi:hydroxyacylglutathione hydrolase
VEDNREHGTHLDKLEGVAMTGKPENPVHIIEGRASPSYIIDGSTLAVVDVCFPSDAERIIEYVRGEMGRRPQDIGLIMLTHSHLDHVNGVDRLIGLTGAELAAHVNAGKYLRGERAIKLARWRKGLEYACFMIKNGLPRPSIGDAFSMPWSGVPGIKRGIRARLTYRLKDGDSLPGCPDWKVVHTPGHTDDSCCLYNARYRTLISGDTLVNLDGKLALNPLLRLDDPAMKESLDRLQELDIYLVYPGWGRPLSGSEIVRKIKSE